MTGGGSIQTAAWPMSEDMLRAQETDRGVVLRRVRGAGVTPGGAPKIEWFPVATIGATVARTTQRLQMTAPGETSISTHVLSTRWRRAKDPSAGGAPDLVLKARDIFLSRSGQAYYVHSVNDAGGAHVWLEAEVKLGELADLQSFAGQG